MSRSRFDRIDGLRAVAISAVFVNHFSAVPGREWIGQAGVDLFFVLSGFLISGILLDARSAEPNRSRILGAFAVRRVLRIVPVYLAAILAAKLCGWIAAAPGSALPLLTGTFNWFQAQEGWVAPPHLWSLCVEEQFYLVWPFLMLFAPRRALPWLMGAVAAVGPVWRAYFLQPDVAAAWPLAHHVATPACFDPLALGGLLAYFSRSADRLKLWKFLSVCRMTGVPLVACYVYCLIASSPPEVAGVAIAPLLANAALGLVFVGVVWRATTQVGGLLAWGPARYVGRISYGLYAYHLFMPAVWNRFFGNLPGVVIDVFYGQLLLSFVAAVVSYHLVELPLLRLKKYFPYARRTTDRSAPATALLSPPPAIAGSVSLCEATSR